ncbi:MAG: hypothetical protein ABIQ16_16175 [Polyangiaceae bacterium]
MNQHASPARWVNACLLGLFLILARPPEAAADPLPPRQYTFLPLDPFHAGLVTGFGVGWLTKHAAQNQYASPVGFAISSGLTLEFLDLVTASLRFGTVFLKDQHSFTQEVVDETGKTSTASSENGLTLMSWAVGLRSPDLCLSFDPEGPAWRAASGFARVGRASIHGYRQINHCIDCDTQQILESKGSFVESGVQFGGKNGNGLGSSWVGSFRHYFGGSPMSGEIHLGFGLWYF